MADHLPPRTVLKKAKAKVRAYGPADLVTAPQPRMRNTRLLQDISYRVSPEDVKAWMVEMVLLGRCDGKLTSFAGIMGVSRHTLYNWLKEGADYRTAMAMTAMLKNDRPYGEEESDE